MKRAVFIILVICAVLSVMFFFRKMERQSAENIELMIYCGAGIRPAASAVMEAFEAEYSIKVHATYAGSGRLLGQISSLQRGDLYMPGAGLYVDKAIEKNLAVADSRKTVAYFVPVILTAKGNPKGIRTLADLCGEEIRVGLGDERACAIGRQTLKLLAANGIDMADVERNIVYKSGTVNELGLAIQMNNVDAVVLWDANARHFAEYGDQVVIPRENNMPAVIPIVLLESSRHKEAAKLFIDFITSKKGRSIFIEKGYTVSL